MQPPDIRLAFIGTGDWARSHHLPALEYVRDHMSGQVNLTLQGIFGIEPEQAEALRSRYGFARQYRSLDELIADDRVNAVAVVISPSAVRAVVLRLEERGVPFLTEKPPGVDFAEAEDLAVRVRTPHVVALNRRYKPLNNRFRELVSAERALSYVRGSMFRVDRREDLFILHTGIHLINYMEYLFGPIMTVRAEVRGQPGAAGALHIGHVVFESGLPGEIQFAPRYGEQWEGVTAQAEDRTLSIRCPLNRHAGLITSSAGGTWAISGDPGEAMVVREGIVAEYMELFDTVVHGASVRSHFGNAGNCLRIAGVIEAAGGAASPGVD
jgi:predicted dehydrogenase